MFSYSAQAPHNPAYHPLNSQEKKCILSLAEDLDLFSAVTKLPIVCSACSPVPPSIPLLPPCTPISPPGCLGLQGEEDFGKLLMHMEHIWVLPEPPVNAGSLELLQDRGEGWAQVSATWPWVFLGVNVGTVPLAFSLAGCSPSCHFCWWSQACTGCQTFHCVGWGQLLCTCCSSGGQAFWLSLLLDGSCSDAWVPRCKVGVPVLLCPGD